MEAILTMDRINMVQSAALRKILIEQFQYRSSPKKEGNMAYWKHDDSATHNDESTCLCVPLAGGL